MLQVLSATVNFSIMEIQFVVEFIEESKGSFMQTIKEFGESTLISIVFTLILTISVLLYFLSKKYTKVANLMRKLEMMASSTIFRSTLQTYLK